MISGSILTRILHRTPSLYWLSLVALSQATSQRMLRAMPSCQRPTRRPSIMRVASTKYDQDVKDYTRQVDQPRAARAYITSTVSDTKKLLLDL